MSGRALGIGALRKVRRGNGPVRWVLDFTDAAGRRHRQNLGTDRRVAERRRVELIRQRDLEVAGLSSVEGMGMPLADLREAYLEDLATRVGAKQIRSVTDSLARVLAWLPAQRVRDVRALDVLRFRADRLQRGASNRTANVDVAALSAMLRWAASINAIAENPLRSIRRLPTTEAHQRRNRRALSDAEIEAFLSAAQQDDLDAGAYKAAERTIEVKGAAYAEQHRRAPRVPQAALWRFLVESGCRWGETVRARWVDLDVERRAITLRGETTKSGRSRMVPLRRELVDQLLALRPVHQRARQRLVQPTDRLFLSPEAADWKQYTTNARRGFRRILELAAIDRIDASGCTTDIHSLRGTCATRMLRNRVPLPAVQRVLGHSSPAVTMKHYAHLDVDDLRSAVEFTATTPPIHQLSPLAHTELEASA